MAEASDRRGEWLRRRNALWLSLRLAEEGSDEFEATLNELSALIGWERERVLAGLGVPGMTGPGRMLSLEEPDEREED